MEYGLIVDVETTGLDSSSDHIIEVGILEFMMIPGMPASISRMYGALDDPGIPVPPEIEKITGISSQQLSGQSVDWALVASMMSRAKIVIAHNMEFDRGFFRARKELKGVNPHWGCSIRHIDWKSKGASSLALNYLAADHGFVNPFAHRALFDCATTFRLISGHLDELIQSSYLKSVRIDALNSPFEKKDLLKEQGYRWDSQRRIWHKTILESNLDKERLFLEKEIYLTKPSHKETVLGE
ncbi:MAG: 3'-5' exonuclease [Pseudomonadota bacterium]